MRDIQKLLFLFILFLILNPIQTFGQEKPIEGNIVEDKLEQKRYQVIFAGSYRDIIKQARDSIQKYKSMFDTLEVTMGRSEELPIKYIVTSPKDSISNSYSIIVEEEIERERYSGLIFYLQSLEPVTLDEFGKRWKVIE